MVSYYGQVFFPDFLDKDKAEVNNNARKKKKQANNKNKKKINILTYCHLKVNKFVNRPEKLFFMVSK